jgi:hypothetical protein
VSGRANPWPDLGRDIPDRAEKRRNCRVFFIFFLYFLQKSIETQKKNITFDTVMD